MTPEEKRAWYSATCGLHDIRRDCLEALQQDRSADVFEMLGRLKRVEVQLLKIALTVEDEGL